MLPPDAAPLSPQAWLTEIHEYAQKDVVIMLLGNKVRVEPPSSPTTRLSLPRPCLRGRMGPGGLPALQGDPGWR